MPWRSSRASRRYPRTARKRTYRWREAVQVTNAWWSFSALRLQR